MLGIPLDLVEVDISKGAQRRAEFLAINPMGRVPVLEDGDFILTESAAIMAYLADSKPGNSLYPAGLRERAQVNRWLFWAANHWSPVAAALAFENMIKRFLKLGEPEPIQVNRQEEALRGLATVLDVHLASRAWVCGTTTTIADLAIAPALAMPVLAKLPVQSFAHVQAWFTRVQALEAWTATEMSALPPAS
jgi:glutathione S-transferase